MGIKPIVDFFKSITIEPVIFFYILGSYSVTGIQVTTNVMMYKICSVEMGLDDSVCENLGDHLSVQEKVQIRWTQLTIALGWIQSTMSLFYALFAGALSDIFGRKPLIMIPLIGQSLALVSEIINYTFLRTLPLEFIYVSSISSLFGGLGVYHLGVYGYGASVTTPDERAYRLARLDGVETVAMIIATLLSPTISKYIGPYGNYGFGLTLILMSIFYGKMFVREPIKYVRSEIESEKQMRKRSCSDFIYLALVRPLLDMKSVFVRKRTLVVKSVLGVLLLVYSIYNFAYEASHSVLYLYMLKVFSGFKPADYAYFSVAMNVGNTLFLFVFMPLVSGKLKLNDSTLLMIISICETFSNLLSPFMTNLWLFYGTQFLNTIGYCKYSTARSLLSKCVGDDEVGKIFAVQSILNAIVHLSSVPVVKNLYIATIGTFPGAYFLLSAALTLAGGFGNFFVVTMEPYVKKAKEDFKSEAESSESICDDDIIDNTKF